MQFKLTSRFLLSVIAIVTLVIIANTIFLLYFIVQQQRNDLDEFNTHTIEQFTRQFDQYVTATDGIVVAPDALSQLDNYNAWLQIVNSDGLVVYNYNAPADALTKYRPVDTIQNYRFKEQHQTTVFVGDGEVYNYIIGVKNAELNRVVFTYETSSVIDVMQKLLIAIAIIDLLIILMVGWIFSLPITKPVATLIERIQLLKTKQTTGKVPKRGLYAPVFNNLQQVATDLAQADKERQQLETMREEWISNVTHDLKTPLASIRGYAELLDDAHLSDEERLDYAKTIEKQAEHMKNLINDLNLTMRLRNQQLPMSLEMVNVVSFVREIVIDLLNDPLYAERDIQFDTQLDSWVRDIDVHYMRRALLNFIYNALHHNDASVAVSITVTNNSVIIQDNGKGIPADDVHHVFERYYRGTNTAQTDGTGLGMAIAHDIVIAHKGTVTLTSSEHIGTTVTIMLL
ncbi:sensor histidine kinase [Caryophanon tenue]|uniref:histidine kinase n=1 Tax=Caryophanon tenue TaxID=33978 RepID=A0A1C0YHF0_9BACL|nr:HAMP domain-containing sensor histidine kinase [Caryophanon tenue]OCS86622.1 hypothetical protein A6M13_12985 [Caryophanon tenue]